MQAQSLRIKLPASEQRGKGSSGRVNDKMSLAIPHRTWQLAAASSERHKFGTASRKGGKPSTVTSPIIRLFKLLSKSGYSSNPRIIAERSGE